MALAARAPKVPMAPNHVPNLAAARAPLAPNLVPNLAAARAPLAPNLTATRALLDKGLLEVESYGNVESILHDCPTGHVVLYLASSHERLTSHQRLIDLSAAHLHSKWHLLFCSDPPYQLLGTHLKMRPPPVERRCSAQEIATRYLRETYKPAAVTQRHRVHMVLVGAVLFIEYNQKWLGLNNIMNYKWFRRVAK
jgi:hypothetical protein